MAQSKEEGPESPARPRGLAQDMAFAFNKAKARTRDPESFRNLFESGHLKEFEQEFCRKDAAGFAQSLQLVEHDEEQVDMSDTASVPSFDADPFKEKTLGSSSEKKGTVQISPEGFSA